MTCKFFNAVVVALTLSTCEIELIARLLYSEARGECLEGQMLVVQCVLDRVENDKWFGNSVRDVIFARNQFASLGHLQDHLVRVVRLGEFFRDDRYQILYFRRTQSRRNWYAPYLFTVGNHSFYGYLNCQEE